METKGDQEMAEAAQLAEHLEVAVSRTAVSPSLVPPAPPGFIGWSNNNFNNLVSLPQAQALGRVFITPVRRAIEFGLQSSACGLALMS